MDNEALCNYCLFFSIIIMIIRGRVDLFHDGSRVTFSVLLILIDAGCKGVCFILSRIYMHLSLLKACWIKALKHI